MKSQTFQKDYRTLLDATLTELALYAKELCPEAVVAASDLHYEDEDGRVEVFPPPGLSEEEEERIEQALAEYEFAHFQQVTGPEVAAPQLAFPPAIAHTPPPGIATNESGEPYAAAPGNF
jgi:hypothetical protein